MPPIDTESQFKFLLACIKHSTNGKVSIYSCFLFLIFRNVTGK